MITVKQIERAWTARQYERLFRDLVACRIEATLNLDFDGGWATPAAAMALIRMDELSQTHLPMYGKLLRAILAAQQSDPELLVLIRIGDDQVYMSNADSGGVGRGQLGESRGGGEK